MDNKEDSKYDDLTIYDLLNQKVELGNTDDELKIKKKALEELNNLSEEEKETQMKRLREKYRDFFNGIKY